MCLCGVRGGGGEAGAATKSRNRRAAAREHELLVETYARVRAVDAVHEAREPRGSHVVVVTKWRYHVGPGAMRAHSSPLHKGDAPRDRAAMLAPSFAGRPT